MHCPAQHLRDKWRWRGMVDRSRQFISRWQWQSEALGQTPASLVKDAGLKVQWRTTMEWRETGIHGHLGRQLLGYRRLIIAGLIHLQWWCFMMKHHLLLTGSCCFKSSHCWHHIVNETFQPRHWVANVRMQKETLDHLSQQLSHHISRHDTYMRRYI